MGLQKLTLLVLFFLSACGLGKIPPEERPFLPAKVAVFGATPTSANFSWQWTQGLNTPDITGFKLSLGTAPGSYTRTIDIPDKTARTYTATGLDLTKINYAIVQSYTSFGIVSVSSTELPFGGQPSSPVFLTATPATP